MKCVSLVHSEESRIDGMMKTPYHDNSTLNLAVENNPNTNKAGEKDTRCCDYCKRPKQKRETCWKLNGRPQQRNMNGKFSKTSKGFQIEIVSYPLSYKRNEVPFFIIHTRVRILLGNLSFQS